MISRISFSTLYILSSSLYTSIMVVGGTNILSAVTKSSDDVFELYQKIIKKEPHLTSDTTTDEETKKQICQSIIKNAYFDLFYKADPVEDIGEYYDYLRNLAEQVKTNVHGWEEEYSYYSRLLEDFRTDEHGRHIPTYHSRSIPVFYTTDFGFPCLVKRRIFNTILLFFISDSYDMNAALDIPNTEPIQTRFLCVAASRQNQCLMEAMVEEPAIAFASPEYSLEVLEYAYLKMKKNRYTTTTAATDPLCGLKQSEKLRACASVMNSSHFADKVRFNPDPKLFDEKCELNKVSFWTERAKTEAKDGNHYQEWMLSCSVSPITDIQKKFKMFLSRAYQSHHAVVYRYNEQDGWTVESISGRISVIIDIDEVVLAEEGFPAPNLVDLLKQYGTSTDGETPMMIDSVQS